jgi:hypothetical protein
MTASEIADDTIPPGLAIGDRFTQYSVGAFPVHCYCATLDAAIAERERYRRHHRVYA